MAEPIVFISRSRVLEGKLDGLRRFMEPGIAALEAEKPGTLLFVQYLDPTGFELTIIHAWADAAAMDAHMEGVAERSAAAYEFIESRAFEIYGQPSDAVRQMMEGAAARAGIELKVHPEFVGGWMRLQAGGKAPRE